MAVRSSFPSASMAVLSACAMVGVCTAGAARAQTPPAAPMTADDLPELGDDVPAAAQPKSPMMMAKLNLDTPVSRLCANPKAKAVLDTDLPGLTTRPEFPFFKNMSLNALKRMSRGQMSDADLAKVQAELAQLDVAPQGADR